MQKVRKIQCTKEAALHENHNVVYLGEDFFVRDSIVTVKNLLLVPDYLSLNPTGWFGDLGLVRAYPRLWNKTINKL